MQSRRQFIQNAAILAGSAGTLSVPESIKKALAIESEKGSSFLDAEHVVILMQENRSFDHAFGSLQGVRGFNDPRAIKLPDGNPVWMQATAAGERFVPFRLDIKETKSTWMGSLPHGWPDQVDAYNAGKHDRWLQVKKSGNRNYSAMPLTLGYHTREDLPFYYAFADAFTICDQHFCSSLTGTTPNRLHLWTGTVRAKPSPDSPALVRNEDCDYGAWVSWMTFPERLEDRGVSWKIYQNELTVPNGLTGEADAWLANFGDSPLEWFTQFCVRFAATHREFLEKQINALKREIEALQKRLPTQAVDQQEKTRKLITDLSAKLAGYEKDLADFSTEKFDKLSAREKSLHARAFCTNNGDPAYRELVEIAYKDGDATHRLKVPKGDVLHQFRTDVASGSLPTVSWIVAPEKFSDHPSSAWYGSWYVSEVLDVLTQNPKVWKKTVFILTYDENDGYFDHVPPFVAPHPKRAETGLASKGIDTSVEYVELEQDRKHKPRGAVRGSPIGLGYRVPMIIASPWSRGGCVCSQVFDHTSVLRFLEVLISHKTGKKIEESNITRWRRTVCGDLTSAFQTEKQGGRIESSKRDAVIEAIHKAQFKKLPTGFHALTKKEIEEMRAKPSESALLPKQEPGVCPSCPLPYQLEVEGALSEDKSRFTIRFAAKKELFGDRSAGSPFIVYAIGAKAAALPRNYAVAAGEQLEDSWPLDLFDNKAYRLHVYGPNGFFREFSGDDKQSKIDIRFDYVRVNGHKPALTGNIQILAHNRDSGIQTILVRDNAYNNPEAKQTLAPGEKAAFEFDASSSFGWYNVSVRLADDLQFEKRYAGRVETGRWSFSDPAMGRDVK